MTPPDRQQRPWTRSAAAAAAAAVAEVLPAEVLAHVFSLLCFNEQQTTVALVSKHWHAWALQQRGGEATFCPKRWQPLPAHAVQHAWNSPGLLTDDSQRQDILACVAGG